MAIGPNATGWSELMDTNVIGAVFIMYDTAFVGFTIAILFIIYQFMLYLKTQNLALGFITGILFASLYVVIVFFKPAIVYLIFIILAFELGAIFYMLIWK